MATLLQHLGKDLNESLLRLSARRTFSANELIFSETEEATFLPIVRAGKVKMVRYPEVGKEVILGVFGDGEIFAIPPALDGKRFPATAVAIEESQLLMLPRRDFLDLMKSSAEFSSLVMARMCGILRDRADTVQILATPSAEHRVATVLLRLAGNIEENEVKRINHRRQDIAEMSGVTLETAIRMIKKLEGRGFFSIVRGKIFLETTDRLREFVG